MQCMLYSTWYTMQSGALMMCESSRPALSLSMIHLRPVCSEQLNSSALSSKILMEWSTQQIIASMASVVQWLLCPPPKERAVSSSTVKTTGWCPQAISLDPHTLFQLSPSWQQISPRMGSRERFGLMYQELHRNEARLLFY